MALAVRIRRRSSLAHLARQPAAPLSGQRVNLRRYYRTALNHAMKNAWSIAGRLGNETLHYPR
jgi:hypothetical protein